MTEPQGAIQPARKMKKLVVSGGTPHDPRPRSLYIAIDGTMDITNDDATTEAGIPIFAGTIIPLQASEVTAISVADSVYGFYD